MIDAPCESNIRTVVVKHVSSEKYIYTLLVNDEVAIAVTSINKAVSTNHQVN